MLSDDLLEHASSSGEDARRLSHLAGADGGSAAGDRTGAMTSARLFSEGHVGVGDEGEEDSKQDNMATVGAAAEEEFASSASALRMRTRVPAVPGGAATAIRVEEEFMSALARRQGRVQGGSGPSSSLGSLVASSSQSGDVAHCEPGGEVLLSGPADEEHWAARSLAAAAGGLGGDRVSCSTLLSRDSGGPGATSERILVVNTTRMSSRSVEDRDPAAGDLNDDYWDD